MDTVEEQVDGCWASLIDPTPEEIARVRAAVEVPEDFLTHALDRGEQARTEREDGAMLVVLRVPFFQGEAADIPHITVPLGIVVTDRYLVTVCAHDVGVLRQLTSGAVRGLSTVKHNRFVLHAMHVTAQRYPITWARSTRRSTRWKTGCRPCCATASCSSCSSGKSLVYFTEASSGTR